MAGLVGGGKWRSVTIDDHTANSHILDNLEEFAQYEIITQAYNDVGSSELSPVAVERTRESGMSCNYSLQVSWIEFHKYGTSIYMINPYPTVFPYGNGTVLHFYQQQESSTTKTVHKVINKGLKAYV